MEHPVSKNRLMHTKLLILLFKGVYYGNFYIFKDAKSVYPI